MEDLLEELERALPRLGEDIGFDIRNLNRFVTWWSRRPPRRFFIINRGLTTDISLIHFPFFSHLELLCVKKLKSSFLVIGGTAV